MADIRFPSVIIVTGERALVHYDLFAISRVLPTVPKIRLSCILCTTVCAQHGVFWHGFMKKLTRYKTFNA
jgi:hypothetical protein